MSLIYISSSSRISKKFISNRLCIGNFFLIHTQAKRQQGKFYRKKKKKRVLRMLEILFLQQLIGNTFFYALSTRFFVVVVVVSIFEILLISRGTKKVILISLSFVQFISISLIYRKCFFFSILKQESNNAAAVINLKFFKKKKNFLQITFSLDLFRYFSISFFIYLCSALL